MYAHHQTFSVAKIWILNLDFFLSMDHYTWYRPSQLLYNNALQLEHKIKIRK
jgi:hypothetical protein